MQETRQNLGLTIPSITAEEIDEQVKPVLRDMEKAGIQLDGKALNKLAKKLGGRVLELKKKIIELAGREFNIDSPSQMAEVLFSEMKLPVADLKKTQSGVSTAASELRKIEKSSPIIPLILENRELSKLISTYLKPLPILVDENSRLHTTYGLETATGRLTSSEPNLQNIPIRGDYGREIRSAFVAGKGMKLISADYSQIELRVVACLAKDGAMIEAFRRGEDIHSRTAAEIFNVKQSAVTPEQRRKAKTVNFGIVYGQTPYGLAQGLNISVEEAGDYIAKYFKVHKGIKNYVSEMIAMAQEKGYVETLFGTRRYLPNISSHIRFVAEGEERMAINMPVQGTAAEILKLAMIELDKKLVSLCHSEAKPKNPSASSGQVLKRSFAGAQDDGLLCPRMLLTVHDELVVEASAEQAEEIATLVKETMETVVRLCVPVTVEVGIGDNWGNAK